MKRSTAVALVISGSLLVACDNRNPYRQTVWYQTNADGTVTTNRVVNNSYRPGYGYWHSRYHSWYPLPFNYYDASRGYYHGGTWSSSPESEYSSSSSGGHSSWSGSRTTSGGSSRSSSSHSSVSRGGFGSSSSSSS